MRWRCRAWTAATSLSCSSPGIRATSWSRARSSCWSRIRRGRRGVPDVVLAPLLAFDRQGGRLGYGMGYYDRTLDHLRSRGRRPLAIGIAFAAQEVDEVPTGPADVPLDGVITERALHRFPSPVPAMRRWT